MIMTIAAFIGHGQAASADAAGQITVGTSGSLSGYKGSFGTGTQFGTLTTDPAYKSDLVNRLYSTSTLDLVFEMVGVGADPGQFGSYFTSITCEDENAVDINFLQSASVGYIYSASSGGTAQWQFGDGTSRLWTSGDNGNLRDFTIFE